MTTRGKATGKSERLAVLNRAEQEALYGLPDFDDAQRLEFLAMDESELALACSRQGLHAQIYCILQIAYFGVYAGTPDFSVITAGIECLAGQGIALVLLSYQLQL
jgi:hypothetical protein